MVIDTKLALPWFLTMTSIFMNVLCNISKSDFVDNRTFIFFSFNGTFTCACPYTIIRLMINVYILNFNVIITMLSHGVNTKKGSHDLVCTRFKDPISLSVSLHFTMQLRIDYCDAGCFPVLVQSLLNPLEMNLNASIFLI